MFILVATMNFNDEHIKSLMDDICTRLSWKIQGEDKLLLTKRTILIGSDIRIVFRPALAEKVRGLKPDYFWSNSYDCDDYLRYVGSKELKNFDDLVNVVKERLLLSIKNNSNLPERYKTCGRCVHDGEDDPNIPQSTCYLCKRNSNDHRIDLFEKRKEETNE